MPVHGRDDPDPFPLLSSARADDLWHRPERATVEELYSASLTTGKTKDWERAVFFLWCAQVRLQFERAIFPPKEKGGNSPTLSLLGIGQMLGQAFVPMLYASPESHRRLITRFKTYTPDFERNYRPSWPCDLGIAKADAQVQAKKMVTALSDSSARILELTAIPEYLKNLKIYADNSDQGPDRPGRFRTANETMWRIEEEKKIKSGLAYQPIRPAKTP